PAAQVAVKVQALTPARHASPTVRGPQVPSTAPPVAMEQAWQSAPSPPQAVSQQTPSTQKLDVQSPAAVHAVPFAASACAVDSTPAVVAPARTDRSES